MTSGNGAHTLNTIKGHGLAVGDRFMFHGLASDSIPTVEGTRVELSKVGNKYMITTVAGEVMTWEFGPSAKVWADTTVSHHVTTEARTLDNGDTVHTGKCEHGWMTGFHTTEDDARAVAEGHGEVSRPLYVAPVALDASDVAEYNAQQWAEAGNPRDAKGAPIVPVDVTGAEVEAARVAVRDNGRVFVAEAHNFGGLAAFAILVESGTHTLINDGDMSRWVRTRYTSDRVKISDGLAVWDYNGDAGRVDLSSIDGDGWFYVNTVKGSRSLMNGERVTTNHRMWGEAAHALTEADTVEIPTPAEVDALRAEHDAAMSAWAVPLVNALTAPVGLGAIADSLAASDRRHAAALAAEVSGNPWGPCGPCDGTSAPMARKAHPCGLVTPAPAVVEIHTGTGDVITEADVRARFRQAFGPEVTEAEVWAGTGTMIKRPIRALMGRRKRKATKVNARRVRGGF